MVLSIVAAILAAVEGDILPPGKNARLFGDLQIPGRSGACVGLFRRAGCPAYAGEMPATPLTKRIPVSPARRQAWAQSALSI